MSRSIALRFHRYTVYGPRGGYGPGRGSGKEEKVPKAPTKEEIEAIIARYIKPQQQG